MVGDVLRPRRNPGHDLPVEIARGPRCHEGREAALAVSGGSFGANIGATFWSKDTLEGVKEDDEGLKSLRKTVKRFAEHVEERRMPREDG